MGQLDWLMYQLCDSALPAGGFAHSCGLEAAWQHGLADATSIEAYLRCQMQQAAHFGGPFLNAAHRQVIPLEDCDRACDAMLSNHVANRASRAQGKSMAIIVSRIFKSPSLETLAADIRGDRLSGHFAPVFGRICRNLDIELIAAVRLFLFITLRGLVSAAVRLGVVGPLEGQVIQWRVATFAEELVLPASSIPIDDATQTAPLLDLVNGTQDRLYSRLFQS